VEELAASHRAFFVPVGHSVSVSSRAARRQRMPSALQLTARLRAAGTRPPQDETAEVRCDQGAHPARAALPIPSTPAPITPNRFPRAGLVLPHRTRDNADPRLNAVARRGPNELAHWPPFCSRAAARTGSDEGSPGWNRHPRSAAETLKGFCSVASSSPDPRTAVPEAGLPIDHLSPGGPLRRGQSPPRPRLDVEVWCVKTSAWHKRPRAEAERKRKKKNQTAKT